MEKYKILSVSANNGDFTVTIFRDDTPPFFKADITGSIYPFAKIKKAGESTDYTIGADDFEQVEISGELEQEIIDKAKLIIEEKGGVLKILKKKHVKIFLYKIYNVNLSNSNNYCFN